VPNTYKRFPSTIIIRNIWCIYELLSGEQALEISFTRVEVAPELKARSGEVDLKEKLYRIVNSF